VSTPRGWPQASARELGLKAAPIRGGGARPNGRVGGAAPLKDKARGMATDLRDTPRVWPQASAREMGLKPAPLRGGGARPNGRVGGAAPLKDKARGRPARGREKA